MRVWSHDHLSFPLPAGHRFPAGKYGLLRERVEAAGLATTLDVAGPAGSLPDGIQLAAYRVVQEALTNISRHARARNAELVLRREGSEILCTVRDDGIGFDAAKVQSPGNHGRGLGLIGMKERLSAVGGSLVLSSLPGRGSELVFAIPLELSYVGTNTPR